MIQEDVPAIYLFSRMPGAGVRDEVKGLLGPWNEANGFGFVTSYLQDVYVER